MADVIITPVSESVFNVSVNVVDPDLAQLAAEAEAAAVSSAASAVASEEAYQQSLLLDGTQLHKTGDETKTGNLTIIGKQDQTFNEDRFSIPRPVVNSMDHNVSPSSLPTQFTDYHFIDINSSFEGDNINTDANLYAFEVQGRNNSSQNSGRIVSSYFLVENNSSGNMQNAIGLQLLNRTRSTGNITSSRNIWVRNPTKDSTGIITNAYGIYIDDFIGGSSINYGIYSLADNFMRRLSLEDSGYPVLQITRTSSATIGVVSSQDIKAKTS